MDVDGNRLVPGVLKRAIEAEDTFDFLKDVVASVPDFNGDDFKSATPKKRKRKDAVPTAEESQGDDDNDDDEAGPSRSKMAITDILNDE